ncbi:hypothetical protein PPERSA_10450 [Pseudocohnilembus persalinus]|uniref:Uncharacterized protein n=1 Tax=Pseudocohnilembus persalinus TaxID=266149 RepID=A0A0V0R1P7_PSEPJ|nr:hypothetical protein PPERSA_10450 [Pseudocohnilembus persalinus]|eukprot:KRX08088.1 hypothetical protein PPERSA_10450 [Pseudocohnilembus persalinus]
MYENNNNYDYNPYQNEKILKELTSKPYRQDIQFVNEGSNVQVRPPSTAGSDRGQRQQYIQRDNTQKQEKKQKIQKTKQQKKQFDNKNITENLQIQSLNSFRLNNNQNKEFNSSQTQYQNQTIKNEQLQKNKYHKEQDILSQEISNNTNIFNKFVSNKDKKIDQLHNQFQSQEFKQNYFQKNDFRKQKASLDSGYTFNQKKEYNSSIYGKTLNKKIEQLHDLKSTYNPKQYIKQKGLSIQNTKKLFLNYQKEDENNKYNERYCKHDKLQPEYKTPQSLTYQINNKKNQKLPALNQTGQQIVKSYEQKFSTMQLPKKQKSKASNFQNEYEYENLNMSFDKNMKKNVKVSTQIGARDNRHNQRQNIFPKNSQNEDKKKANQQKQKLQSSFDQDQNHLEKVKKVLQLGNNGVTIQELQKQIKQYKDSDRQERSQKKVNRILKKQNQQFQENQYNIFQDCQDADSKNQNIQNKKMKKQHQNNLGINEKFDDKNNNQSVISSDTENNNDLIIKNKDYDFDKDIYGKKKVTSFSNNLLQNQIYDKNIKKSEKIESEKPQQNQSPIITGAFLC